MRGFERFGELSLMARSQKCKASSSSSTKKPTARQEWRLSRCVRASQRITWLVIDDHPLCLRVSHDAAVRICMFASCLHQEYVGFRLTNHLKKRRCDIYMYGSELQIRGYKSKPLRMPTHRRTCPSPLPIIEPNIATLANH